MKDQIREKAEKEATKRIDYLNKKSGWRGFIEGALWMDEQSNQTKDLLIAMLESQLSIKRAEGVFMADRARYSAERALNVVKRNELERQINELKG